jgi:hypothetical protein
MVNANALSRRRGLLLTAGVVFVVALALRLAHFYQVRDNPLYTFITLDERGNHDFAVAILQGKVPPVSYYKAPLYHYFLAGVYAVVGPESIRARFVQCLLVSLCPVLTALVARRLFGSAAGLIAGLWAAVFWTFVHYATELLDAGMACLLYMLLAWILVAWDDRRWIKWLAAGAVLGLGAITRPNILPFAPVLAILVLLLSLRKVPGPSGGHGTSGRSGPDAAGRAGWRRGGVRALALSLGCCAAVLPVTLRNRIVGGEWVLIGAYGGLNIHVANNPCSDSKNGPLLVDESRFLPQTTWDANEPWARCCLNYKNAYRLTEATLGRRPTPGEFSSHLSHLGWQYIRENPRWFAGQVMRRFCWLFNAYEFPSNKDHYQFRQFSRELMVLSHFHYGWMAPLALLGLGLALARPSLRTAGLACLVAMWASLALPALMFIINARFRVPMVNLMVPFASFAVVEIVRVARSGAERWKLAIIGPVLGALALFSNLNLFGYRQDHEPYLRFAYAVACMMSGRADLLDKAITDFEHDLAIDLDTARRTGQRSNTTLLMDHCTPMRLLLPYYVQRGLNDKAHAAARQMLEHEGVDGAWAVRVFGLAVSLRDKDLASRALQQIVQPSQGVPPPVVAEACLRFGQVWNDPTSLERAMSLYEELARSHPDEIQMHRNLETVKRLLSGRANATTQSVPTTRG